MSSSEIEKERVLREVRETKAELCQRIEQLESLISTPSVAPEGDVQREVIEPEAEVGSKLRLELRHRGVEDGPPAATKEMLGIARARLTSSAVPYSQRVYRSLSAGHWAWSAIETHTVYTPVGSVKGL